MGGKGEDTIESKPEKGKKPGETVGAIRFHEAAAGEVHFHDDAQKLKVAVPAAEWWRAWRAIRHGANEGSVWTYHDTANATVLWIRTDFGGDEPPTTLEVNVSITEVQHGPAFAKLEKFAADRKI